MSDANLKEVDGKKYCERCGRLAPSHWQKCRYCLNTREVVDTGAKGADGNLCKRCGTVMHQTKLKGDQTVGRRYYVFVLKCHMCGNYAYLSWRNRNGHNN